MAEDEQALVLFTPEKLKQFKAVYARARLNPLTDVFEFEGREYVLGYARYLIEYLEDHFRANKSGT